MVTEKLPAPDGGWGWFIVLGTSINHVLIGVIVRTIGVYYLEFEKHFGASATATSWIPGLSLGLWNGLGPLTTMLCNRFSHRKVAMLGALLTAAGLIITGLTSNIIVTYFSFGVLLGCGLSFIYLPGIFLVGEYFDKRMAGAISLSSIGSSLGAFVGPPLVQFLFDYYGYFGGFLLIGAIGLQACISATLFRSLARYRQITNLSKNDLDVVAIEGTHGKVDKSDSDEMEKLMSDAHSGETCKEKDETLVIEYHSTINIDTVKDVNNSELKKSHIANNKSEKDSSVEIKELFLKKSSSYSDSAEMNKSPVILDQIIDTAPPKKPQKKKIFDWSLFKELNFVILSLSFFAMAICLGSVITFLPALAIDKGMGQTRSIFLLSVVGISDCLTRIPLGFMLDVPAVKRYRTWIYFVFQCLVGILVMLMPTTSNYWVLVVICALRGLVSSILMPQRLTIIGDMFGVERAPSALCLQLFTMAVGAVISRVLGGIFKDFLGQYDPIFYLGGVMQILTSCTMMVLLRIQHKAKLRANEVMEICVEQREKPPL